MHRLITITLAACTLALLLPSLAQAEESSGTAASQAAPAGASPADTSPAASGAASQGAASQARSFYLLGSQHAETGDWEKARAAYRQAYQLYPAPSTLYNLGYCESQLGHLVEAWLLVSQALDLADQEGGPGMSAERREAAEAERQRLLARLSSIVLAAADSTELLITPGNIEPIPGKTGLYHLNADTTGPWMTLPSGAQIYLNPGVYRVSQRHDGQAIYQELTLAEGTTMKVFSPEATTAATGAKVPNAASTPMPNTTAPESASTSSAPQALTNTPRPYRTLGIAGFIFGGVSLAAALASIGVLIDAESKLDGNCPNGTCPPEFQGTVGQYEAAAVTANVGLIAGVTSSLAGAGFLLLDRKSAARNSGVREVTLLPSPLGLRLHGRF